MGQVQIAARAYEDLDAVWDYLAPRNLAAATQLMQELTDKFVLLSEHPMLGRSRQEFWLELRSFVVKSYLIFYQPTATGVEIVRVLHSSRDVEAEFKGFFDSL